MKTPLNNPAVNQPEQHEPASARSSERVRAGTGDSPRLVIRGESFNNPYKNIEESHPYSAHTDWLNFTLELSDTEESINEFRKCLVNAIGKEFEELTETGRGKLGFRRSFDIGNTGGIFAIGSQQGRALISLSGISCQFISKDGWANLVSLMTHHYDGRITRWDGAVDDFEGAHSVDWAVDQYLVGGFSTGGNKPFTLQHGDWVFKNGNGRTFTVGRRKNGKFLRVYEKGKEQGDPKSEWVRWELQLGKKGRTIPWHVLLVPGQYVAGAYACTTWVSDEVLRIKTFQKKRDANLEHLKYWCSKTYGGLLNELLETMNPNEVIECLVEQTIPKRLAFSKPVD
jgi:phage replication initiation protein